MSLFLRAQTRHTNRTLAPSHAFARSYNVLPVLPVALTAAWGTPAPKASARRRPFPLFSSLQAAAVASAAQRRRSSLQAALSATAAAPIAEKPPADIDVLAPDVLVSESPGLRRGSRPKTATTAATATAAAAPQYGPAVSERIPPASAALCKTVTQSRASSLRNEARRAEGTSTTEATDAAAPQPKAERCDHTAPAAADPQQSEKTFFL